MRNYTLPALCVLLGFATQVVGQATTKPSKAAVEKPPIVTAEEWGSTPQPIPAERKHTPRYITIHHAGVLVKSTTARAKFVKNMQAWGQREKKWPDLAYHFLIAPDGRIFQGRDIRYEGETNTKYPLKDQVQVELMGDFTRQRVSPQQLQSLVKLTAWLCAEYDINPILMGGHNDRAPRQTSCPGTDLYRYIEDGQLTKWVTAILAGKRADVKERPPLPDGPTVYVGDPAGDAPR